MTTTLADRLVASLRDVPDFPTPGIIFKDIAPVLLDAVLFADVVDALVDVAQQLGAQVVAGVEARGFVLGAPVAVGAGCGYLNVRKAGKLPGAVVERTYDLEYGTATLAVQAAAVTPGARVLLVDDVLATGGTVEAASGLLREVGADVVGLATLLELGFLGGRTRLAGLAVRSLLSL